MDGFLQDKQTLLSRKR